MGVAAKKVNQNLPNSGKLNGDGYTWRKFFKNHDVRIRDDVGSLADQAADAAGASR